KAARSCFGIVLTTCNAGNARRHGRPNRLGMSLGWVILIPDGDDRPSEGHGPDPVGKFNTDVSWTRTPSASEYPARKPVPLRQIAAQTPPVSAHARSCTGMPAPAPGA
ncbi:MAG: hypothetical protein L6Q35_02990, partial [Phycisphaerales bacterium]|nr:hypothetical protein [Phycisphaerales bacterium]